MRTWPLHPLDAPPKPGEVFLLDSPLDLKDIEMRNEIAARNQTEACAVERAPVIERLNDCVDEAGRYRERLERLRNVLNRAGMLNNPPSAKEPGGPVDRPSFSLQEVAMQLPGNLANSNNEFSDMLDTLERQLIG